MSDKFIESVFVVDNDELGGPVPTKIKCDKCNRKHSIKSMSDNTDSISLQFYTCNGADYLAGIRGRLIT